MARRWLEVLGNPYEFVLVDSDGRTAIDFGVYGAPETFVIDKKGLIRYKVVGAITSEIWDRDLKGLIHQLEAE